MSILNKLENLSPFKQRQKKFACRRSIPLPVLSLQTREIPTPQRQQNKKTKQSSKSIIRDNFKKMLEVLNQPQKKTPYVPANFHSKAINQSKEVIRKRMKTNFQLYNPKINHLIFKTHILDAMDKLDQEKSHPDKQPPIIPLKQSIANLHRTSRFIKRNKKSSQDIGKTNRFIRWQNFCTSLSYNQKFLNNLPTISMKKARSPIIKERSQSTLGHMTRNDELNGWEDAPVRYLTDYDHTDFNDIVT